MSLPGGAARKRLRVVAVMVVVLLAAGIGHGIESTPPTYFDSATVMFSLPRSQTAPMAYYFYAPSLIMSGEGISQILTSPQVQDQIRRAGGTAIVSLPLVNLYNEEYPDYGVPLATLTTASQSAAAARRTFMIAARLIGQILATSQANAGVSPRNRISAQILAATGPVVQKGSSKRVFAGLALLAAVATSMLWGLIDRRVTGLGLPLPRFRGERRATAARRRRR
jgi:hypothetical protein